MGNEASVIVNLAAAVCAAAAIAAHTKRSAWRNVMKYFTSLSNVFCAAACLAVAACRLAGGVPRAVLALKYAGTAALAVTMLTVLFFLIPQYGAKALLGGPDLWLHLLCPVMALISYFLWDRPAAMPFACVLCGVLPVLLYGVLYLRKVVFSPPEKRWEDFYGFNRGGRWPLSFLAMLAAAFAVSLFLWAA